MDGDDVLSIPSISVGEDEPLTMKRLYGETDPHTHRESGEHRTIGNAGHTLRAQTKEVRD